jgi:hypoxanthine-DNA glycosylase
MSSIPNSAIEAPAGGRSGLSPSAGFPPVAGPGARLLILGSLPGRRSLAASEYYAHERNAFWRIMEEVVGASGTYHERCRTLLANGIALWDVLASSVRPGSLDADIRLQTAQPNEFRRFFREQPGLERIGFNGRKAADLYARLVRPQLAGGGPDTVTLPSTSPAHAAMPYTEKLARWRAFLEGDVKPG